jgi:hypothetical protein
MQCEQWRREFVIHWVLLKKYLGGDDMGTFDINALREAKGNADTFQEDCDRRVEELIVGFAEAASQIPTPLVDIYEWGKAWPILDIPVSYDGRNASILCLAIRPNGELLYKCGRSFKQVLINQCNGVLSLIEEVFQKALIGRPYSKDECRRKANKLTGSPNPKINNDI